MSSSSRVVAVEPVDVSAVDVVVGVPVKSAAGSAAVVLRRQRRRRCCALKVVGVGLLVVVLAVLASMVHTYQEINEQLQHPTRTFAGADATIDTTASGSSKVGVRAAMPDSAPASAHGVVVSSVTCTISVQGRHLAAMSLDHSFELVRTGAAATSGDATSGRTLAVIVDDVNVETAVWLGAQSTQTKFTDEDLGVAADASCSVTGNVAAFGGLFDFPFSTDVEHAVSLDMNGIYSILANVALALLDPELPTSATSGSLASLAVDLPAVVYNVGSPQQPTHRVSTAAASFVCQPEGCQLAVQGSGAFASVEPLDVDGSPVDHLLAPLSGNGKGDFGLFAVATSDNAFTHLVGGSHSLVLYNDESFSKQPRLHRRHEMVDAERRALAYPDPAPYDECTDFVACYMISADGSLETEMCLDVAMDLSHFWINGTVDVSTDAAIDVAVGWYQVSSDGMSGVGDVIVDVQNFETTVLDMVGEITYDHDGTAIDVTVMDDDVSVRAFYDVEPAAQPFPTYDVGVEVHKITTMEGVVVEELDRIKVGSMGAVMLQEVSVVSVPVPGLSGEFNLWFNMSDDEGSEPPLTVQVRPFQLLTLRATNPEAPLPVVVELLINISNANETETETAAEEPDRRALVQSASESSYESSEEDRGPRGVIGLFLALDADMHMHAEAHGMGALAAMVRRIPDPAAGAADDALVYDTVVVFSDSKDVDVPPELIKPRQDHSIDYDALAAFSRQLGERCANCSFGKDDLDGDDDDNEYSDGSNYGSSYGSGYGADYFDRRALDDGGDSSKGDGDDSTFFKRGNLLAYMSTALGAVTAPLLAARMTGVPSIAHARSYVHIGHWAANATSQLASPTNAWMDLSFDSESRAPVVRNITETAVEWSDATLELHLSSEEASGIATLKTDVIGYMDADLWRNATGMRASMKMEGDLTDASYAADAAFIDIVGHIALLRDVPDEAAFRIPDWMPPPAAAKNATDFGRSPQTLEYAVGAAMSVPAEVAGMMAMIGKDMPEGTCVTTSRMMLLDTSVDGPGLTSFGKMVYESHPAAAGDVEVTLSADMNSSMMFRPDNESHVMGFELGLSAVPAATRDEAVCSTEVQVELSGGLQTGGLLPHVVGAVRLHHCKPLADTAGGNHALGLLDVVVGAGTASNPNWAAAVVKLTAESADMSTVVSDGTTVVVNTLVNATAIGSSVVHLGGSSSFNLGVNQNAGGVRSSHFVVVEIPMLMSTANTTVDVATLNAFVDDELMTVVAVAEYDGGALADVDVAMSIACGTQCTCQPDCSSAQLLSSPSAGSLRDYGEHGFQANMLANVTVMGTTNRVILPVNWVVPAPAGDGDIASTLFVGGLDPVFWMTGASSQVVYLLWNTTIEPADHADGALPSGVTVSDTNYFNFTTDFNLSLPIADTEVLCVLHVNKVSDSTTLTSRGSDGTLFKTSLDVVFDGSSVATAMGAHRVWPDGAGFNSSHELDIASAPSVTLPQLDLFTGPDVARVNIWVGENGVKGRIHLASPMGFVVAHVVDAATASADTVLNVNFFFQNYTALMAPYAGWGHGREVCEAEMHNEDLFVVYENAWAMHDPVGADYVSTLRTSFTAGLPEVGVVTAVQRAALRTWGDGAGNERGGLNMSFDVNVPETLGWAFDSRLDYEHADNGETAWTWSETTHLSHDVGVVVAVGGVEIIDVVGTGAYVHHDDREAREASLDYNVSAVLLGSLSGGLASNVVTANVTGDNHLSHYSGRSDTDIDMTVDRTTTVGFISATSNIMAVAFDVVACLADEVDACNERGGDPDRDSVCSDDDSCPMDQENDADSDQVCGDVDSCPYDAEDDGDGDDICGDVDSCPLSSRNDADEDGLCGDVDSCPLDVENDADSDDVCGDQESCPNDAENDLDDDDLCGDVDKCPYDRANDADSDGICGDVDSCALDGENDFDGDELCGDVDRCPDDAENDVDKDLVCGNVDPCPYDHVDDADSDGVCHSADPCPFEANVLVCTVTGCPVSVGGDADSDGVCGSVDVCPVDVENDQDGDNFCEGVDACPNDPNNDADSDGVCGEVDSCAKDPDNDADGDSVCGDVDVCPMDADDDVDDDDLCADVDACPADTENDADSDAVCGDVDECPYDPDDDVDGDDVCADVDSCPLDTFNDIDSDNLCFPADSCQADAENDADSDGVCGDADVCPYDPEDDIDGDNLCADVDPCPSSERPPVNGTCADGQGLTPNEGAAGSSAVVGAAVAAVLALLVKV